MAPRRRSSDGLLARVNFPLYAIEMLTSRHVLVAGGGGSSNSGVANGFEIYELYYNGTHFCAEEVLRHETGGNVVMNFAVSNDGRRSHICAGQESHCQIYDVQPRVESVESGEPAGKKPPVVRPHENGVRQRANSGVQELSNDAHASKTLLYAQNKRLLFSIKASDLVQTAFEGKEPLQRVVRISLDGRKMATGGTDGYLRVWSFPQVAQLAKVAAHTKEIDDIDFSPDGSHIASTSKDGHGYIWAAQTLEKKHELCWPTPEGAKYLFKRVRYGTIEGSRSDYRLFAIANPLGKVGRQRAYLQLWDATNGKLRLAVHIDESLASLAVRDDGRFVAVGTMFSGSVSMYIAFSLQRVLHIPNAHSMFVTGLQFLPVTSLEGPPISSDAEAAVLSISVDNRVCIHSLQHRRTIPAWIAILLIVLLLIMVFLACSYFGL